jgi:hypothetical protein
VSLSRRQDTDKTLVCSYGSEQTNVNFVLQVKAMDQAKAAALGMPKRLKYHLHAEISSWID